MAELLMWVEDKPPTARVETTPQAGDVIVSCPDGWPWSERELAHPSWRVVVVAAVPHEQFRDMTTPLRDEATGQLLLLTTIRFDPMRAIFAFVRAMPSPVRLNGDQVQALMAARILKSPSARVVLK